MASKIGEVPKWGEKELSGCLVEESSFATLFPRYLEKYLKKIWPTIEGVLATHKLVGEMNVKEGSLSVKTTSKTWDPYAVVTGRDFMKLLSRGVPVAQAQKIFEDEMGYDIIKVGNLVASKKIFLKRRQRLIGPGGKTLKAVELLTKCYILVQGNTVACMGPYKGCRNVRNIVEETMHNIHPIYAIKRLMVQNELERNPDLQQKDWSRLLPCYRKKPKTLKHDDEDEDGVKKNKQKKRKEMDPDALKKLQNKRKKEKIKRKASRPYSAFPPEQLARATDKTMEAGEAWLSADDKTRQAIKRKGGKGLSSE